MRLDRRVEILYLYFFCPKNFGCFISRLQTSEYNYFDLRIKTKFRHRYGNTEKKIILSSGEVEAMYSS